MGLSASASMDPTGGRWCGASCSVRVWSHLGFRCSVGKMPGRRMNTARNERTQVLFGNGTVPNVSGWGRRILRASPPAACLYMPLRAWFARVCCVCCMPISTSASTTDPTGGGVQPCVVRVPTSACTSPTGGGVQPCVVRAWKQFGLVQRWRKPGGRMNTALNEYKSSIVCQRRLPNCFCGGFSVLRRPLRVCALSPYAGCSSLLRAKPDIDLGVYGPDGWRGAAKRRARLEPFGFWCSVGGIPDGHSSNCNLTKYRFTTAPSQMFLAGGLADSPRGHRQHAACFVTHCVRVHSVTNLAGLRRCGVQQLALYAYFPTSCRTLRTKNYTMCMRTSAASRSRRPHTICAAHPCDGSLASMTAEDPRPAFNKRFRPNQVSHVIEIDDDDDDDDDRDRIWLIGEHKVLAVNDFVCLYFG